MNCLLVPIVGLSVQPPVLVANSTEEADDFADLLEDANQPPWPESFGDRLFVIKFNFTKNVTTGKTIIGENNSFN